MAGNKWISDLRAATPLADAARRVLTVRLEGVRDCLPLALHQADKDPEYVHRLRVSTRRARAALDIFAPCLPGKVSRKARKRLRRIRGRAGEARDWDVFLAHLIEWSHQNNPPQRPGLYALMGYALDQRMSAQAQMQEISKDYPFSFDYLLARTVAAVHKPRDSSLRKMVDLALPLLSGLLEELDAATGRNMESYEHLHQVRIIGKRLRYAMEVFADCFAPAFREQIYPTVEAMQEVLGNANDSHLAAQRLEAMRATFQAMLPGEWKRLKPGVEALLRGHQARLVEERQRFLAWWNEWQKSGAKAAFHSLLKPAEVTAAT
jgi:CHAD domain-containing protein